MLLQCQEFFPVYGDRDNYAVINKQGIVRYNAFDHWPYGNRYHIDEIQGCVDSLVSAVLDVGPAAARRGFALTAAPDPFRSMLTLDLVNPTGRELDARVAIYDLAGREVALLWNAPAVLGVTRLVWSGARADGGRAPAGIYLARARIGTALLTRRIVRIP